MPGAYFQELKFALKKPGICPQIPPFLSPSIERLENPPFLGQSQNVLGCPWPLRVPVEIRPLQECEASAAMETGANSTSG